MRFVRTEESYRAEVAELICAAVQRRKDDEDIRGFRGSSKKSMGHDRDFDKLVCVTSGVSFLGRAIVERLLIHGYSVRIIVDSQEDMEKVEEMDSRSEMRVFKNRVGAVIAKLTQVESLMEAFDGCSGVFHSSAFVDPCGVSGYSKSMAEVEAKVSETVMEACGRTASVRKCVFTSSLLACVWRDDLPSVVNQDSWSDESLCTEKKLWYALGKLKAEKAAWRIAEANGLKLATICPGLITATDYVNKNSTATIAYLKGAQEMYSNGLLATVDISKVAEAHAVIYKEMNTTAFGRYVCYDNVVGRYEEGEKLANEVGISVEKMCGDKSTDSLVQPKLSDRKLISLLSRTIRSCSECI